MVIDGVIMDADAKGDDWLVSVRGAGREPLAVASAPVAKGMVVQRAVSMIRELRERANATRHVGFGAAYSRKCVIREAESFARECHVCQEPREQFTGNLRMFTYEKGHSATMCATHLARALSYRTGDGRYHEVTTAAVEAIGDAQRIMAMRDSLAARAMIAMITGEVDAPSVAEAPAQEARQEASAETCAAAAESAADRAERAAEAAASKGPTDADGAWADVGVAERAARDADVCARQIPAVREAHGDRARAAVDRARAAVDRARAAEARARRAADERQAAADDERCGMAAADEAEAAADRWATGCPRIGDFPAMLAGWVQEARAAASEASQAAEYARAAVTSRAAQRRPWGVIEWYTIAGARADDARDAAERAQQAAKLAAAARGRADRAAQEAAPDTDRKPAVPGRCDASAAETSAAPAETIAPAPFVPVTAGSDRPGVRRSRGRVTHAARAGVRGCSPRSARVTAAGVTGHVTGRVTVPAPPAGGNRSAARRGAGRGPAAGQGHAAGGAGRHGEAGPRRGRGASSDERTVGWTAAWGRPQTKTADRARKRLGGRWPCSLRDPPGRCRVGGQGGGWRVPKNKEVIQVGSPGKAENLYKLR
ncbi:hypothetical protein [Streptomyces sp. NPDC101115]|uniref:hypothetical protein n=1 Tax=Streptomyces sp. NPDC101115 TaxID=3366106 RepID=UPI00380E5412